MASDETIKHDISSDMSEVASVSVDADFVVDPDTGEVLGNADGSDSGTKEG